MDHDLISIFTDAKWWMWPLAVVGAILIWILLICGITPFNRSSDNEEERFDSKGKSFFVITGKWKD
jgi:hypothetical protein